MNKVDNVNPDSEDIKKENNFLNKLFKRENYGKNIGMGWLYVFLWLFAIVIVFNQNAPIFGNKLGDFLLACYYAPIYIVIFIILKIMGKTQ
jgi:hypothetical protein